MYRGLIPIRSRAITRRLRDSVHSETEHPAEARKAVDVPLEKRCQHDFRVTVRAKSMAALLELAPQLRMIINLPIEDDNSVAIFREEGLITGLQVDNFQPCDGERDGPVSNTAC